MFIKLKSHYFLLLLFFSFFQAVFAQKALRLDRVSKSSSYFHIGEELTFKLKGDDVFYTYPIKDIFVEENKILFEIGLVSLDDISHLRQKTAFRTFLRSLGRQLKYFTYGYGFYSAVYVLLYGWTWTYPIIAVAGWGTGFLLEKIPPYKTISLRKNARLRTIDLTPKPIIPKA